ncbi:MAG: hypothetical protein KDB80_16785 [Planctomycetes bacterium]|nr:hypothetical protein [Planctomycetota bacterium]
MHRSIIAIARRDSSLDRATFVRVDIVLVSGRAVDGRQHPSAAAAMAIAGRLVGSHRVRWLCVLDREQDEPCPPSGVEFCSVRTTVPPFRSALARIFELSSETRLMELCRDDPPDVVHCIAFGAAASVQLPWLAGRLGIPTVVSVDPADALCHRGTLVDERGATCTTLDDAVRCADCCLSATPGGLGPIAAWLGRRFMVFGDASPWPSRTAMLNRLDSTIGGLVVERNVIVDDERDRVLLESVGVAATVLPRNDVERLGKLYERLGRSE